MTDSPRLRLAPMGTDDVAVMISRAEGLAALGMHLEALEIIEKLPQEASVRRQPAVIAVRLIVCTGLKQWKMGHELCDFAMDFPDSGVKEAIGRFFLARA